MFVLLPNHVGCQVVKPAILSPEGQRILSKQSADFMMSVGCLALELNNSPCRSFLRKVNPEVNQPTKEAGLFSYGQWALLILSRAETSSPL